MSQTTHYTSSSKGPVLIATMAYPHALNARDRLARDVRPNVRHPRQAEMDALSAHIASLKAEQEVEARVNGG